MEMKISKYKYLFDGIIYLEKLFKNLITILPSFEITNKRVLPYGLKPHTRSISWLAEQVITQQCKFNKERLHLSDVNFDMSDTCLHDCIITDEKSKEYFVNIKVHNIDGKENINDISAVEKIYMQYKANKNYDIYYVCLGVKFEGIKIVFDKEYLKVFTAQFLPIYVNPRNDKIQAKYNHIPVIRSREEFLMELVNNSKNIHLE